MMSTEFYAIIGVGVSTLGFLTGLTAVLFYLLSQVNRRMDRLGARIDRLEDRFVESINLLGERVHSLDKRVAKLEWMFEAEFRGRPMPPDADHA